MIYELSDYLNPIFLENTRKYQTTYKREDVVLYNPRKGFKFTKKLISRMKDVKWVALQGMTHDEMSDIMLRAKVYIDFGNHPGKDRIPREAAISGCCIVTGKDGSAFYQEDVDIPARYKFDKHYDDINHVIQAIYSLLENYEEHIGEYQIYRRKIEEEPMKFQLQVDILKGLLMNG